MDKCQITACIRKVAEDLNVLYIHRGHERWGKRLTDAEIKRLGEIIEEGKQLIHSLNSFSDDDFVKELSDFNELQIQIGKWQPIILITHTENEDNPELKTLWNSICGIAGEIGAIIAYYNKVQATCRNHPNT